MSAFLSIIEADFLRKGLQQLVSPQPNIVAISCLSFSCVSRNGKQSVFNKNFVPDFSIKNGSFNSMIPKSLAGPPL